MIAALIRHGQTAGNLENRYIGSRTDESLCVQGVQALAGRGYPAVKKVYASPMKRCLETAALIYPSLSPQIVSDFRECDFGDFEGLNYSELNGRADYQRWIDSGGELPFPGGESRAQFAGRCVRAYEEILKQSGEEAVALVVHGGTVMAIMEAFARPRGGYFDFQVKNGEGFLLERDGRYRRL